MGDHRLLARLNDETRAHHAEADRDVDEYLFKRGVTAADYRTYLSRAYGFLVPLEASLATAPGLDDVIDVRARAKSALVVRDLLALGMTMAKVNELPQCLSIPTFRGPAAALGWMYVVERPLLSSAVVRGHLARHLGAEFAIASAYLSCYAGQVGATWRGLGVAMERIAHAPAIADRIVMSAHEAFRAQQRFRSHELAAWAPVRIAG